MLELGELGRKILSRASFCFLAFLRRTKDNIHVQSEDIVIYNGYWRITYIKGITLYLYIYDMILYILKVL